MTTKSTSTLRSIRQAAQVVERSCVLKTAVSLAVPLMLALAAAPSSNAFQQPGSGGAPCQDARDVATHTLHQISAVGTRAVRNRIDAALVLFRLGRTNDAKASLDAALTLLDVTRRRLMTIAERDSVRKAVDELQRCIDTSTAPSLATLTVRTYEDDDRVAGGRGAPAEPGALVRIDQLPVGRTGAGGIFRGRVPSGSLRVTAEIPPSNWGEEYVNLAPGGTGIASIVVGSSKEVTEETPLVVSEAEGGLLSAAARTLTLKFIPPEGTVRIRRIHEIDLPGPAGNIVEELASMFRIADGAMVAVDAAEVIGIIRARSSGPVVLRVMVSDGDLIHASEIEFRIE